MIFVRSATISVAKQKKGGELVHPIGKASRKATSASCPTGVMKTGDGDVVWH